MADVEKAIDDFLQNREHREPKGGWAAGTYLNKCMECDKHFVGDKRARSCAPCAYGDQQTPSIER